MINVCIVFFIVPPCIIYGKKSENMKYLLLFIECFAVYFYLVIVLRMLGKKELSQITITDLIVFLLISELMTISIGDDNISFFQGAFAVLVIIVIDKMCSYISLRYKPFKMLLEGNFTYVIFKGKIMIENMKKLNYSVNDLCHHLREKGICSVKDVEFAILETNGALSVIEKKNNHVLLPDSLIHNGVINHDLLDILNKNEKWLIDQLNKENIDYKDIYYCVLEDNNQLFYIKK